MLLVGLGNPGAKYANTRHNLGFMVVRRLVERGRGGSWTKRCQSATCRVRYAGESFTAALPQTFMNLSGGAVECLLREAGNDLSDLLVVCDDVSLPFGMLRLRKSGGDGGQKGIRDIISRVGEGFGRLRIGCGPAPQYADLADFVLSPFPAEEASRLPKLLDRAVDAVVALSKRGYQQAMATYNGYAPGFAPEPVSEENEPEEEKEEKK